MLTGSFADRREGKAYRKEGWFMGRRVMQSGNAVNQEIEGGISVCASLNVRPQFSIPVLLYSCNICGLEMFGGFF